MTSPATDLTEIEKSLCWLIADQTGITPARVTLDAKIVADLGLDSLDLVELIMACEEHFGVALPDEGDNAVYQSLFNRTGSVAELAELIFLQSESKRVPRDAWEGAPPQLPESQCEPFTQLGSRLSLVEQKEYVSLGLHDTLGKNDRGQPCFRRRIDGLVCVKIPAAQRVELARGRCLGFRCCVPESPP